MGDGASRVGNIVKSLRNFSRLDEAESKTVDIHEGIDNTLTILKSKLKAVKPRIEIVKEYGDLPTIECYPAQLNQVILNLTDNAIHAIAEHHEDRGDDDQDNALVVRDELPTLMITTGIEKALSDTDQDQCVIRIRDNGAGIPADVRDRIFDPFFTTKPVGQGTGLGLSISYKIITDTHRGSLVCESSLGQGSEFIIRIPIFQGRRKGEEQPREHSQAKERAHELSGALR